MLYSPLRSQLFVIDTVSNSTYSLRGKLLSYWLKEVRVPLKLFQRLKFSPHTDKGGVLESPLSATMEQEPARQPQPPDRLDSQLAPPRTHAARTYQPVRALAPKPAPPTAHARAHAPTERARAA